MDFDWKKVVASVAPGLATALGGPLAGGVVSILADKILGGSTGDPVSDEAKLAGVLAGGLTPELQAKILDAQTQLKIEMVKAGLREKEIDADTEKAYIADADSARHAHAQNQGVLWLGYLINLGSYLLIAAVLFGSYRLLSGYGLKIDPGLAATVGALVGGAVQWVMANAAQANGFFFGSSPGSRDMARQLGSAVASTSAALGKK